MDVADADPAVVGESSGAGAGAETKKESKKRARDPDTAPLPDELTLPQSAIMRIVKSKLPEGMLVGSDTKKAFGKACSLFILYVSTMCAVALSALYFLSRRRRDALRSTCAQCGRRGQGEQPRDHVGQRHPHGAARPRV